MARPKVYRELPVTDIDMKGHGVVRKDGYVLFVPGALPGDVIDASVRKRRSGSAVCRLLDTVSTGIERIEPFCSHFADCGGCVWQDIPYDNQLELKTRMVEQALLRFGAIPADHAGEIEAHPILGCRESRHYRNRLDYSFSSRRWIPRDETATEAVIESRGALGFHAPGRFDKVLEIETCHLQPEPTNAIRNSVARFTCESQYPYYDAVEHVGFLRNLVVRTTLPGEVMVLLVVSTDEAGPIAEITGFLSREFSEITSIYVMINPTKNDDLAPHAARHIAGAEAITERCGHIALSIHPKSFYQTNPAQAERLYGVVRDWAGLTGTEEVLDLYCGIGSIGLFLARECRRVVGLELIEEAVERAKDNAALNNIANAEFHVGAAEDVLPGWAESGQVPDLIVTDPPRAGMHPRVIEALRIIKAPRIIYVSCNPRSQAEDVASLGELYRPTRYRPVDMFPHTRHVENVIELALR